MIKSSPLVIQFQSRAFRMATKQFMKNGVKRTLVDGKTTYIKKINS